MAVDHKAMLVRDRRVEMFVAMAFIIVRMRMSMIIGIRRIGLRSRVCMRMVRIMMVMGMVMPKARMAVMNFQRILARPD